MKKWQLLLELGGLGLSCCAGGATALIKNELYPVSHPIGSIGLSRIALAINEKKGHTLKYFYSNLAHNGQTRWYEHTIKPYSWSWDWTWVNATTNNCIEIEEDLPDGSANYYVIVLSKTADKIANLNVVTSMVYKTNSNDSKNPNWKDIIWESWVLFTDYFDGWNYHAGMDI